MGQTFTTMMSMAEYFSINPPIGGVGSAVFSCNGIYDPVQTNVTHQPYGFDQLSALYSNYCVLSSTAEFTVWPTIIQGSATIPTYPLYQYTAGLAIRDKTTSFNNLLISEVFERPDVTFRAFNSYSPVQTMKITFNRAKFYGSSTKYTDSTQSGSGIANPTEQAYFHFLLGPSTGGVDLDTIQCFARFKYKVVWFNPIDTQASY